jgi:dCMP deaminase
MTGKKVTKGLAGTKKSKGTKRPATIKKTVRPTWDQYFVSICEMVGSRGTCDRGKSGCVIVKDKRILTTGYVGSPVGLAHCDEVGHEMHKVTHDDGSETMHCIRTVHAEQNAIVQAARNGVALMGATLYCKMTPCYVCAKLIINAGISRVVAMKDYQASKQSKRIFKEAKVKLEILDDSVEKY